MGVTVMTELSRLMYRDRTPHWIRGYQQTVHPKGVRPGYIAIVGRAGVPIRCHLSEVRETQAGDKTFDEVFNARRESIQISKAVTLYRPWPYAIAALGKRIENRHRRPPLKSGEWIAIHAGKKWDVAGAKWIESQNLGYSFADFLPEPEHPTGLICIARYLRSITESNDPWFCGPVGWVFDKVIDLPKPISCRGQQWIWSIPEDVRSQLSEALSGSIKSTCIAPSLKVST